VYTGQDEHLDNILAGVSKLKVMRCVS